jgi:hypothetical protein
MCTPYIDLSDGLPIARNINHMQNFHRREVDVSTTPMEAHKPFGISYFGVKVLDV